MLTTISWNRRIYHPKKITKQHVTLKQTSIGGSTVCGLIPSYHNILYKCLWFDTVLPQYPWYI